MNGNAEQQENNVMESTRRGFFKVIIGAVASLMGLVLGPPFLRTVIHSTPPSKLQWSKVGSVDSLPIGQPKDLNFEMRSQDAYMHGEVSRSVWVIKHSSGELTVFSPICPHLGCHYKWNKQARDFECPCHASVFTSDGRVIGGPAPRSLDTLPHKVEKGELFVQWEEFKVGIPEKVRV
jgi:Rieske Fe-S protein